MPTATTFPTGWESVQYVSQDPIVPFPGGLGIRHGLLEPT